MAEISTHVSAYIYTAFHGLSAGNLGAALLGLALVGGLMVLLFGPKERTRRR